MTTKQYAYVIKRDDGNYFMIGKNNWLWVKDLSSAYFFLTHTIVESQKNTFKNSGTNCKVQKICIMECEEDD